TREAGAIGGWPETRRAPAPLRPSPFIPLTPARPAPSVGGLRQGAPRLRSARRRSFHRHPRGRHHRWVAWDKARPGPAPPVALHSTGAREAATLRGWPDRGTTRLRTSPAVTSAYSAGGRGAGTRVGDLSAARAWSSSTPSVVPGQ